MYRVGANPYPARSLTVLVALALLVAACGSASTPAEDATPDPGGATPYRDEPTPDRAQPTFPEGDGPDGVEPVPDDVAEPIQAAWVHLFDDTLKSGSSIETLVDEAIDAGLNTLIAQVVRRQDAYYDSEILPRTADPTLDPDLDVLTALLDAAAGTDLEVHAWMSVAPTWHQSYEGLEPPPDWVPVTHGPDAAVEDRWVTRAADGTWTRYLDPALPAVREHVIAVVTELVDRYPVAGVHLDYVRYEGDDRGYHPETLARYAQQTGNAVPPEVDDPAWSDWRREQTRSLMAEVHAALAGRHVILSAPVITWGAPPSGAALTGTRTYDEALQDWAAWARDGVVDVLYPMNYFRAHEPEQAGWFDGWVSYQGALAAEVDTAIVGGVGGWLNGPDAVVEQLRTAATSLDGAALYSFQQPVEGDRAGMLARLAGSDWSALATP
ncbi:MAG: family 10 glycosylhydrolase [Nitriliruptoraceae bacterium]